MSRVLNWQVGRVVMLLAIWALSALAASAQPPVTVTAADPAIGETETVGLVVKVKGKNFAAGAWADFFRSGTSDPAGITVRSTRFVSATEVEATIDIGAGAALSLFDIRVTNQGGRSGKGSDLFQVVPKGNGKPAPSEVPASITFRCYSESGIEPPDPCGEPPDATDNSKDRARDDSNSYGGIVGGPFYVRFTPDQNRSMTLLLGDPALGPRNCLTVGNCNPDGPLNNTNLTLSDWHLNVKPLVSGTWEDLPGGMTAMSCDQEYPGLVHFTFYLHPTPDGHWGLNFNPRAYHPSTAVTLIRVDNLTWTVEATAGDVAELISFAHSGIRKRNGPSREGFFVVPFKATIVAASLPSGGVTCN